MSKSTLNLTLDSDTLEALLEELEAEGRLPECSLPDAETMLYVRLTGLVIETAKHWLVLDAKADGTGIRLFRNPAAGGGARPAGDGNTQHKEK